MRLNFSGVGEDQIREGIRRLGEVVREQVALYGTLTGVRAPARAQEPRRPEPVPQVPAAQVPAPGRSVAPPAPAAPPAPVAPPAPPVTEPVAQPLGNVLQLPRKRA